MALQKMIGTRFTVASPAGESGKWLQNFPHATHKLKGTFICILEGSGTNPPILNIRGGAWGTYGTNFTPTTTSTIFHAQLTEDTQIILVGAGAGTGTTKVTFIKAGEL